MSDSAVNLKGKNFLKLLDFTPDEIMYLLDLAAKLKAEKKAGIPHRLCEGKNVALIFEKTSTRTRCAFEVAAHDLGMGTTYLSPDASQIGKKESIHDTARVLGRMFDGIEYRGWGQEIVEELAACAGVPVWNGLTNEFHPTQVLADLLMLRERFGSLRGLSLAYYGDARYNMGNSLMVGCALTGVNFTACAPDGYFPAPELIARCRELAAASGGSVNFVTDPERGSAGADAVYTDVWVSMGEPSEVWAERINALLPYRVTPAVMAKAAPGAVFMHCLPAFHDLGTAVGRDVYGKFGLSELEVSDAVFSSPASVVFDEAENRMHTIKAVMAATL